MVHISIPCVVYVLTVKNLCVTIHSFIHELLCLEDSRPVSVDVEKQMTED